MLNDVLRGAGVAELRSAGAGTGVPVPGNANTPSDQWHFPMQEKILAWKTEQLY